MNIPERVEEVLNDPWLQPIYDSSISKVHKREALETLVTRLLTETDQRALEEIVKMIETAKQPYMVPETQGRFMRDLQALSNPPSQV